MVSAKPAKRRSAVRDLADGPRARANRCSCPSSAAGPSSNDMPKPTRRSQGRSPIAEPGWKRPSQGSAGADNEKVAARLRVVGGQRTFDSAA